MLHWHGAGLISFCCDFCEVNVNGAPPIELCGVAGTSGSSVLPEKFQHRDFCSTTCFWNWVEKYNPNKIKGEN